MEFFDRKEEVFDIQLTALGRKQLAEGKFRPLYYTFGDKDVIYETSHGGIVENQNDKSDRIVNMPRLKIISKFTGEEKERIGEKLAEIPSYDREYGTDLPIGSSNNDDKLPSWTLMFAKGEISSSTQYLSSSLGNIFIPQINLKDLEVFTSPKYIEPISESGESEIELEPCGQNSDNQGGFSDNSTISVTKEEILLKIEEENVQDELNNFDIEIFEIDGNNLIPLMFQKPFSNIIDDILVEEKEIGNFFEKIGVQDAEYYFDIRTDDEIDEETLNLLKDEQGDKRKEERKKYISSYIDKFEEISDVGEC